MRTLRQSTGMAAVPVLFLLAPLLGPIVARETEAAGAPAEVPVRYFDDFSGGRRIIFIVDTSGSMLNKMEGIKVQMAETIRGLKPPTAFDIITASEETKVLSPRLIPADEAGRKKGVVLLDSVATDSHVAALLPAFRAALELQPDRICLITDGDMADDIDFGTKVCQLTGLHPAARIDTLAILSWVEAPLVSLRLIAGHTGGTFRCMNERDQLIAERDLPRAKPPGKEAKEATASLPVPGVIRVDCAGLGSPATAAVFVFDRSLPPALRPLAESQVLKSVDRMGKGDRFNLIRVGPSKPQVMGEALLLGVAAANRRRAADWLKEAPPPTAEAPPGETAGGAAPSPAAAALEVAFHQHAEAVYFFYGPDADLKALRAKLAELNKKRAAPVPAYLVAVVGKPPKAAQTVREKVDDLEFTLPIGPPDEATLLPRTIAAETGGAFTYLDPEDRKSAPATRRAGADSTRSVFGDVGNVRGGRRVVFICGAFHVMISKKSWPKDQLERAVGDLSPVVVRADREENAEVVTALERIAAENGGAFGHTTQDELSKASGK